MNNIVIDINPPVQFWKSIGPINTPSQMLCSGSRSMRRRRCPQVYRYLLKVRHTKLNQSRFLLTFIPKKAKKQISDNAGWCKIHHSPIQISPFPKILFLTHLQLNLRLSPALNLSGPNRLTAEVMLEKGAKHVFMPTSRQPSGTDSITFSPADLIVFVRAPVKWTLNCHCDFFSSKNPFRCPV